MFDWVPKFGQVAVNAINYLTVEVMKVMGRTDGEGAAAYHFEDSRNEDERDHAPVAECGSNPF